MDDRRNPDTDWLAELGERLYKEHTKEVEERHFVQYVIFNIENGKYVVGASHRDAIKAFRSKHGHAPGWCRGIGFLSRV